MIPGPGRRRGRWLAALLALLAASAAGAAELRAVTRQDWANYLALTDARVAAELASPRGFLARDFLAPAEREAYDRAVASGGVPVLVRRTVDARGRPVAIRDGATHHRLAAVWIPGVTLERLLAFVQAYDRHVDFFGDVEASRLIARRGDAFDIFLRVRRERPEVASFNTEHHVVFSHPRPGHAVSRSVTTRVRQLAGAGPAERELPEGRDSGILWGLNSYWRFEERADGVLAECEMVSLSRAVPGLVAWLFADYIASLSTDSLRATLSSLRAGVNRGRAPAAPVSRAR